MTHARKVMSEFRFITDYAWLLPTYPVYVGILPGRFKRTAPHEGVSGPQSDFKQSEFTLRLGNRGKPKG